MKLIKFPNRYPAIDAVPDNIKTKLQNSIDNLPTERGKLKLLQYNLQLAGNLQREYKIKIDGECQLYLHKMGEIYDELCYGASSCKYRLSSIWVNFQKKGEFNPTHSHIGHLSFVIWVKIPYTLHEENKLANASQSNKPSNGKIEFTYNTAFEYISTYEIKEEDYKEWNLLIFPSSAPHQVYPFYTSDDYRISISGNLVKV